MSAAAIIEYHEHAGDESGWYVTFDEYPDRDNGDWEGPFETQEAAQEYAESIIEATAAASIEAMFK